jgi:hypothetical protein
MPLVVFHCLYIYIYIATSFLSRLLFTCSINITNYVAIYNKMLHGLVLIMSLSSRFSDFISLGGYKACNIV